MSLNRRISVFFIIDYKNLQISFQFPSLRSNFLAFFLEKAKISFCKEISLQVQVSLHSTAMRAHNNMFARKLSKWMLTSSIPTFFTRIRVMYYKMDRLHVVADFQQTFTERILKTFFLLVTCFMGSLLLF